MWVLAFRNLGRDRRRTVVTVLSIAIGLLAVLLFLGYVRFVDDALGSLVIYRDGNAHVQVYRKDGPEQLAAHPARYSLDKRQQEAVLTALRDIPQVRMHAAQTMGVGVASTDGQEAVFLARGVDPSFEKVLIAENPFREESDPVDEGSVLLTPQMQDLLGAPRRGEDIQLLAQTHENRINAIDAPLSGSFSTGIEALEDKGLKTSLTTLQSLLDTDSVSRILVLLRDRWQAEDVSKSLALKLDSLYPGQYEVTTWDHPAIGQLYVSFMGFFNMIFAFTGIVVLLTVVATVQHTLAMNVSDRIREVGMLRVMGFSRGNVTALFLKEVFLTASIGAALALSCAWIIDRFLPEMNVQVSIPRMAHPIPLRLDIGVGMALSVCALVLVGVVLAAFMTIRRQMGGRRSSGRSHELVRLLASVSCVTLLAAPMMVHANEEGGTPDEATMRQWLRQADVARGGWGGYRWQLVIDTKDPNGVTTTSYDVLVRHGKALARTMEPKRYRGERILIAERAMWYLKPGLRKPVSVSPQQRLVGEAANGDIAATQYARDYMPTFDGVVEENGHAMYRLRLKASTSKATYEQILYYLDKSTHRAVKAEFLSSDGEAFKTATFTYENQVEVEGKVEPFVSRMKITNAHFKDRYSILEYSKVVPREVPDRLFVVDTLMSSM